MIFQSWLDTRSPLPAVEIADQELTQDALQGLDVIMVLRSDTVFAEFVHALAPALGHFFQEAHELVVHLATHPGPGFDTTKKPRMRS